MFRPPRILGAVVVAGLALALVLAATFVGGGSASAQPAPVGLGTADSFAVIAGTTVTNTGPSVISGDVGVSPGSAVVGFPPGTITGGVIHAANAEAAQAQSDLTVAYNDAAGRTPVTALPPDLGGLTLTEGVYGGTTLGLTGTLTLDAQGNPDAVFIFQSDSTLITAPTSTVSLINGADPCNVYWQVGSSATLDTGTVFVGNILALTSITANTGATIEGRLLARNGAVTLDTNTITRADCAPPPTTTPTTGGGTSTTTGGGTSTTTGGGTSTTVPGPGGPGAGGGTGTGGTGTGGTDGSGTGTGGTGAGGTGGSGTGTGGTDAGGTGTGGTGTGGPEAGGTGTGGPEAGGTGAGGAGVSGSGAGGLGGELPYTGTGTTVTAVAGVMATLVGGALVLLSRRRAARPTSP